VKLRHPDLNKVIALADEAEAWLPTYAGPEPTGIEPGPRGFKRQSHRRLLGIGDGVFARATEALTSWAAHLGAGFEVVPVDAAIVVGQTVLLVTRMWPFSVVAACRISSTEDSDMTFGFTYVTLNGHPECGKEKFSIVHDESDQVFFEIASISRADDRLAVMAGPISRALQRRVTHRYLDALDLAVNGR
jgi:uncharacterized protein (UPF0548 family)